VQTNFKSLPEGKLLWAEWGDSAASKLAVVHARMWRIKLSLSDADDAALSDGLEMTRWQLCCGC
jgi:hypothetical protein